MTGVRRAGIGLAGALLSACAADPTTASQAPYDAAVDTRPAYDAASPEAGPCNALTPDAPPVVDHVAWDAEAPVAQGGSIAPGRYFLTDVSVYLTNDAAAPPLPTRSELHTFDSDGVWQFVDGDGHHLSLATSVDGPTLRRVLFCPDNEKAKDGPFTARPDRVLLFDANGGVRTVFTLTRQ